MAQSAEEAQSTCKIVSLPKFMNIPEAVEYIMDYSEKVGNECGFSAYRFTDKLSFFVEGDHDCVIFIDVNAKILFHTHPSLDPFYPTCHPSPNDIAIMNNEGVGIIGCTPLNEIVYFDGNVKGNKKIEDIIDYDNEIYMDYINSKSWVKKELKKAEEIGDYEEYERLEWGEFDIERRYVDRNVVNQRALWLAIRDTDFLKDFRDDYPL
jgi:hypothetical protein